MAMLQYSNIEDISDDNDKKRRNNTLKNRNRSREYTDSNDSHSGNNINTKGSINSPDVKELMKLINNNNGYEGSYDAENGSITELGDFSPPPRPVVSQKPTATTNPEPPKNNQNTINVDYEIPTNIINTTPVLVNNSTPQPLQRNYPLPMDSKEGFGANESSYYSNYKQRVAPYYTNTSNPYAATHAMISPNDSNKQLIDKLNYMIHLLEEQRDEKTGHVMEEVILYAFLGIFIIFIIDSFARAGKYTR